MKNHNHVSHDAHAPTGIAGHADEGGCVDEERYAAAQKCTWVSVAVNLLLTVLQLVVGYFGRSQALVADGLHSLSDLLSDFLVLIANRQGSRHDRCRPPLWPCTI